MAAFTVILPHRRNPGNDRALAIALDTLMTHTRNDFHLLMDAAANEPLYERINSLVFQARTECVVFWCSDIFASPGWDVPMLERWNLSTVVTGIVVEPGAIGIDPANVGKDFGRTPERYERAAFEAFAADPNSPVPDGIGFPAPYMMPRARFLEYGGLEIGLPGDHHGFTAADLALFDRWRAGGVAIVRARSYVYHMQRYSEPDEQAHEKRLMHA